MAIDDPVCGMNAPESRTTTASNLVGLTCHASQRCSFAVAGKVTVTDYRGRVQLERTADPYRDAKRPSRHSGLLPREPEPSTTRQTCRCRWGWAAGRLVRLRGLDGLPNSGLRRPELGRRCVGRQPTAEAPDLGAWAPRPVRRTAFGCKGTATGRHNASAQTVVGHAGSRREGGEPMSSVLATLRSCRHR